MKIGLKLYPRNLNLIDEYYDLFDFFEVLITPDFDVNKLKHFKKEIVTHAAHHTFGLDLCDVSKEKLNKQIINKAKEAADIVNSKYIIVHSGFKKDNNSGKVMINFLKENFDKRIIFENCVISQSRETLFSTPKSMDMLLKQFGMGMCLDFEHAIITANFLGRNANKFIKDFLNLKPKYFHVSGVDMNSTKGMHKHLFEVENNYEYLKGIKKGYFTLETRHHITKNKDFILRDIEILKNK